MEDIKWFMGSGLASIYLLLGLLTCMAPWFDDEKNSIKMIGIILVWPVFALIGAVLLIRCGVLRLGRDAVALLPKRTRRSQRVVAMSEVIDEPPVVREPQSYQPHQWIN